MISPPPPPPDPISLQSALEQTRCLQMWTRKKISTRPPPPLFNSPIIPMVGPGSSYHESWEEQAFAKDSSGLLGGCVWPPRSYTCSFCRREFRSAQALGGHMNVHRRDRARLKQSASPTREDVPDQYPSKIITTNPNPNSGSYFSPALVLHDEQENHESTFSTPRSLIDRLPVRVLNVPDLKLGLENWKLMDQVGSTTLGKRKYSRDVDVEEEEIVVIGNGKRSRIDSSFSSIPAEVLKLGSMPVEELDLELRLGDPPKVVK